MTYIDPHSKVWQHLPRIASWWNGVHATPVTVEWDLSNRCVLGCVDCHFAHTHTRGPWTGKPRVLPVNQTFGGDLADTALVVRTLRDLKPLNLRSVVWTGGGEPTTHPSWPQIIHKAWRIGLQQGMYTLGGLLDQFHAELLAYRLDWVVVSLDAHTAADYAVEKRVPASRFEPAVNAIRYLTAAKQRRAVVGVSYLLHERNWMLADDMLAFARTLGADYTTFRPTIRTQPDKPGEPIGNRVWAIEAQPMLKHLALESDVECSPERFAEWANWIKHPYVKCCGPMLSTTITPNGKVWICPNRREMAHSELGDLTQETFADIWARHPGAVSVHPDLCRAMCKLHPVNQTLSPVFTDAPKHADFV